MTVYMHALESDKKQVNWQCPPFTASPKDRMGWIQEQLEEGEGFLENQSAYKNLSKNLRIFDGIIDDKVSSGLVTRGLKYEIRKFIETISEVREIGSYSSDAKQYKAIAEMINRVAKGLYLEAQFPRQIRKALQYATVMGRGYIWPKCKAKHYGYGERRIEFEPLGLLDVVPVQVPATNDVQDAYAVTVYEYMPIAEAHGKFPLFQSELKPVSDISYRSRIQARRVDYAERFRYGEQSRNWGNLYCEIRYTFVRDLAVNNYGQPLPMGDMNTSWFYVVPYIGQEIYAGMNGGVPYSRKAVAEDCLIYPFLRLLISTASMDKPMYDGPAFDWSGEIPTVQYDVDDWAWEGMGRSLVDDAGPIESTKVRLERKMDQVIRTSLNPPLGYDRTATGGPKIENFDIFAEDVRAGVDGEPKKILQSLLPDEVNVEDKHFKFLEWLVNCRREQLGINDLQQLAKLKLNISSQDLDKALDPIGPIAKGIASGMEAANAKIAYQLKFMIPQWYDTKRIIEYVGPDRITQQTFDFDPASLVPSHMPQELNEDGGTPTNAVTGNVVPSMYQKVERMRYFAKNLRLISVPSTLLELTQQAEQLKWMSLKFKGAPISWCTTLKKLGIENYGDVPGDTEREKWANEEMEMLALKAKAAKMAAALGIPPDEGKGQGKGGGRPASGKKPMRQEQKGAAGGEPRVVNRES